MIGVGEPKSLEQTSGALQAFKIPMISASPEHAESLKKGDNILTTAPDMSGQARVRTSGIAIFAEHRETIQLFLNAFCYFIAPPLFTIFACSSLFFTRTSPLSMVQLN